MATLKILNRQSLFDVALKIAGNAENALGIAEINGLNITDELEAGTSIDLPETLEIDSNIFNYYSTKNLEPATGLTEGTIAFLEGCEGISCWAINYDFIVS